MSVAAAPAVAPVVPDALIAGGTATPALPVALPVAAAPVAPAAVPVTPPVAAAPAPVVAPVVAAPAAAAGATPAAPAAEVKAEPGLLSLDETPEGEKTKIEAKKELEIKLPDGAKVDEAVLEQFKTLAKETGITSEAASKLVAWEIQRQEEANKAGEKIMAEQNAKWAQEIKADKDIGGANFDANLLASKGFLRRSPEGVALAEAIKKDGLGSYPPLFKFIASLAKSNKEDSSGVGGGGGRPPSEPSQEEKLRAQYPTMFREDGSRK